MLTMAFDIIKVGRRVREWVCATFGTEIFYDNRERSNRVLEEVVELVHAAGLSQDCVEMVVARVYSRPMGEINQEVAGVMVTLLAFSESRRLSLGGLLLAELKKLEEGEKRIYREKHLAKVRDGVGLLPKLPFPGTFEDPKDLL